MDLFSVFYSTNLFYMKALTLIISCFVLFTPFAQKKLGEIGAGFAVNYVEKDSLDPASNSMVVVKFIELSLDQSAFFEGEHAHRILHVSYQYELQSILQILEEAVELQASKVDKVWKIEHIQNYQTEVRVQKDNTKVEIFTAYPHEGEGDHTIESHFSKNEILSFIKILKENEKLLP